MLQPLVLKHTVWHVGAMLVLVLANGWVQVHYGDLTPVEGGIGYDGRRVYAPFAADFPAKLAGDVPYERIQRLLPSYLVWLSFRGLGIDKPQDAHIIRAFRFMNAACLALTVLVWHLIANMQGLGWPGRWLGFLALFVNLVLAKLPWFYPVLLDCPTLLCGSLLCLAFLRCQLFGMFLIVVVASLVSSTIHLWSLPLFLCKSAVQPHQLGPNQRTVAWLLTAVVVVIGVAGPILSCLVWEIAPYDSALEIVWPLFPLSVIACAVGLGLAFAPLVAWDVFVRPLRLVRALLTPGLLLWLLAGLVVRGICEWLKPGSGTAASAGVFAFVFGDGSSIFMRATVLPLVHLVSHGMSAGPVVVIAILRWRSLCRRFGDHSVSMLVFVCMLVILTLDSETRHFVLPLPFLVVFVAREIEDIKPPGAFWGWLVLMSLLLSTAWEPLYQAVLGRAGEPLITLLSFSGPFWGPWIGLADYFVGLVLTGGMLVIFGRLLGRSALTSSASGRPSPHTQAKRGRPAR
jgi:hypothetical protein